MAKLVVQHCTSAQLQTGFSEGDSGLDKFVNIERGIVVFICFTKEANMKTVDKIMKVLVEGRIVQSNEGKFVSLSEDKSNNLLLVPQATLGGKLKGKSLQYHNNVKKEYGSELYEELVARCSLIKDCNVQSGVYGNLQVLEMKTQGPHTHVFDIV